MHIFIDISLWVLALVVGLLGGLYFAFSTVVMHALDGIDRIHAITAMNAINARY